MYQLRPAEERGHANHGWLDTRHTFSFAEYHDPKWMGFRTLRVLNEDRVQPGKGFGTHPHRDMEIVSIVLEGSLAHRDSMGHGSTVVPGDVQVMSAGTGILHSEFNASEKEPLHFVQVWILPDRKGYAPRYAQRRFEPAEEVGRLRLLVSPDGEDRSLEIRQHVRLYSAELATSRKVDFTLEPRRHLWVQVLRGKLDVNGHLLEEGCGLAASDERSFVFTGRAGPAEFLAFDLN